MFPSPYDLIDLFDFELKKVAPNEAWLKWRDSNFNQQLFLWRTNMQYWLEKYTPENRIVTPYERVVDDVDGPKFTQELNMFLAESTSGKPSDLSDAKCIWSKVLRQADGEFEALIPNLNSLDAVERNLRRTSTFQRSYTKEQYNQLIVVVRNLRLKYQEEARLDNTLRMYDAAIKKARDSEKWNDLYMKWIGS